MIDLDELDRLHAAAARKIPWVYSQAESDERDDILNCVNRLGFAMIDAYPALAAEIRVLREERDELARDVGALQEGDEIRALREVAAAAEEAESDEFSDGPPIGRLRAALAKLKEVQP